MKPERWAQIEALYHAALEHESSARAAFLVQACAGDERLRRQITALLEQDDAAFIAMPALNVAAKALAAEMAEDETSARRLVTSQLGVYQLLAPLGRGGMGEVHLALDTRLKRKVAVKLLPAEFTTDAERVRRFAQEARAASALNHPNIITIHEIGESENTHFIVTEYVEGETLRQRLRAAPEQKLNLAEALSLATQIAEALSAAHAAGITHRDIKPENVMVRRDGYVKVVDFGLAKLTEGTSDARENDTAGSSTAAGLILGTPRYMSPEQARGEKVDSRSDLFSLGVVLYETVTGHAPFVGKTTSEVIAAILRDEPAPLAETAPPELVRLVQRALNKDRDKRYQTAGELLAKLKELKQRLEFETRLDEAAFRVPPSGGSSLKRTLAPEGGLLNTRRRVALIAVAALIIVAVSSWFYFRRAPALTEKDTILLADFENRTGEEIFDGMLKQGLAIQLQQTPFLTLLPEAQTRHQLTLMKRPPNDRVTAELARQICERKNLKAFIAGSIAPLGSHYVITLEALNGQNGESLARTQTQAASKEQVLQSLSQAATELRSQLGESLSSIQRFDRSLQEGTTDKPEAFKAYAQAVDLAVSGRLLEAIPFYQRAVEIDPEFAHAYSQIGIMYGVSDQSERAIEYAKKSYELKERAGEIEKSRIVGAYHRLVTGDLNKSIEALTLHRRTFPREYVGPNDLALAYSLLGQTDQALAEARDAIRLNPNFAGPYGHLAQGLLRLNRWAEAKDTLTQVLQQNLDRPGYHTILYQIAFLNHDAAGMQQQLDWIREKSSEYLALDWQTGAAVFTGQWNKARDLARRALGLTARGDTKEWAARYATEQALRGAALGDCRRAGMDAAQGLRLLRGRSPLTRAALAFALCGEVKQAQPLMDDLNKRYPEDTLVQFIWLPLIRAALELQHGKAAQAIEQLQASSRYEAAAEFWPPYLRGQAYLQLKQNPEAAAEFQKILDHRGYAPLSPLYPLAQLGLARATRNRKVYDDFLSMWKDADADLPLWLAARKEAAQP